MLGEQQDGGSCTTGALVTAQQSAQYMVTGLTPGSTTFTANYRETATGDTVSFSNRTILVIPLP